MTRTLTLQVTRNRQHDNSRPSVQPSHQDYVSWTQAMPSRFMAARVGQFLIGHFPMGVYLHRFGHLPSPLYEECGVLDTRGHMLLACPRWAFQHERLQEWLHSVCTSAIEMGAAPPYLGLGLSCGYLHGQTLAWAVLGSCATSVVNEGRVPI